MLLLVGMVSFCYILLCNKNSNWMQSTVSLFFDAESPTTPDPTSTPAITLTPPPKPTTPKGTSKPTPKDTPKPTPKGTTPGGKQPDGGDCVGLINAFRQSKGLKPLAAATAVQTTCANSSAVTDAASGYHKSMGKCPNVRGQCECMKGVGGRGAGLKGCIDA